MTDAVTLILLAWILASSGIGSLILAAFGYRALNGNTAAHRALPTITGYLLVLIMGNMIALLLVRV